MNNWILSELEKIDKKTEYIIKEFNKIKKQVSPKVYTIVYEPNLKNLLNYHYTNKYSIHDYHQICENMINNFICYEYL